MSDPIERNSIPSSPLQVYIYTIFEFDSFIDLSLKFAFSIMISNDFVNTAFFIRFVLHH